MLKEFDKLCETLTQTREYITQLELEIINLRKSLSEVHKVPATTEESSINSLRKQYISAVFIPELLFIPTVTCRKCRNGFVDEHIQDGSVHKTCCDCGKDKPLYISGSYEVLECTRTDLIYLKDSQPCYIPLNSLKSEFDETHLTEYVIYDNEDACNKYCTERNGETLYE